MALPSSGRAGGRRFGLDHDRVLEPERELAFDSAGERLPWLESDDDYEPAGVDSSRIVAFAGLGFVALAALLGGLWWVTSDRTVADPVADGSTIEAPAAPYKTRPDDRGGMQVAGTGDTSFEVAEGQRVEGRIVSSGTLVGKSTAPEEDDDLAEEEASAPKPPQSMGFGVQVGAYSTKSAAEAGWATLSGRYEPLQGRSHRILQGTADSGTIYRLQAVAGSLDDADTLCRAVKAAGGECQVKQ